MFPIFFSILNCLFAMNRNPVILYSTPLCTSHYSTLHLFVPLTTLLYTSVHLSLYYSTPHYTRSHQTRSAARVITGLPPLHYTNRLPDLAAKLSGSEQHNTIQARLQFLKYSNTGNTAILAIQYWPLQPVLKWALVSSRFLYPDCFIKTNNLCNRFSSLRHAVLQEDAHIYVQECVPFSATPSGVTAGH